MSCQLRSFAFRSIALAGCFAAVGATAANADIVGLNGLSGWEYNQSDTSAPADLPDPETIQITNNAGAEARSIFFTTPQSIAQFEATFTYRATDVSLFGGNYGVTLTLQNDPRGPEAIGGTGTGLGYTGIGPSAAVTLGLQGNTSGYFTGGVIGGGSSPVSPLVLASGNPIDVTVAYDGSFLSVDAIDTVTLASMPTRNYIVDDLADIVGGDTAFIGFTASTGFSAANQFISNIRFTEVPEPASLLSMVLLGAVLARRR